MSSTQMDELKQLPVSERLDLVELLWDSIAVEIDSVPLTSAQVQLIDQRLAAHQVDPHAGMRWDELKADINYRA